jgi:hypothetical protein
MGLDTYAMKAPGEELTEEDLAAFEAADIQLCEGVPSGLAYGFRGKVYDDLILEITGESLYQDWIPPERVKRMCEALMKCNPEEAARGDYVYSISESEIISLRKFLKVCAERNLGLWGSW